MADPTQPSGEATSQGTPEGATTPEVTPETQPVARTVEEVEAEYKARISGKDRAHAAEAKVLRDQIAALEAAAEARSKQPTQPGAQGGEADPYRLRAEQLEKDLTAERRLRVVETRKAKYPSIAEDLDDDVIAAMDEGKLAGLAARLSVPLNTTSPPPPSLIDPNGASRTVATPTPREKTADDLKADLARMGKEFVESLGPPSS